MHARLLSHGTPFLHGSIAAKMKCTSALRCSAVMGKQGMLLWVTRHVAVKFSGTLRACLSVARGLDYVANMLT